MKGLLAKGTKLLGGLLVSVLLFSGSSIAAQECNFDDAELMTRPGRADLPTDVFARLYVNDITKIQDVDQSFVADVVFRAEWSDPRLAHSAPVPCLATELQIWAPQIQSLNLRVMEQRTPPEIRVSPAGEVVMFMRGFGEFSFQADLADFPFDQQVLPFVLISRRAPQEVVLRSDSSGVGMADRLSVSNWAISFAGAKSSTHYLAAADRNIPRLDIVFDARRLTGYYTWKLIVPLLLVVMMSWAVFWMAPIHVAPRVGLAATAMLTLIAYRFALGALLPPIAYLTRMDIFLVFASVLVFAALAVAVVVTYVADHGREDLAHKITRVARWLSPLLFVGLLLMVFR
jgi:hypothetical protein